MTEVRLGRQTPTQSVVLTYTDTRGQEAIDLYNQSGRTAQEWQELLLADILAINDEGLWVHTKYGYSVPRRNGKNEIVVIRELYALTHGEKGLHTAHRTTTSSSASKRLADMLNMLGYTEIQRPKKDETYTKSYTYSKQYGLEKITLLDEGGGSVDFRTRSSKGGLGEGFDLLVIDEAQEYTDDQESALKYVVSDSKNPQTIFCGTPPTAVSGGTIFTKLRNNALRGETVNTGWAEWSVTKQSDVRDVELWYETNPSLGTVLTERKILDEVGTDDIDFNIQRLGLWIKYNQKSAISRNEWEALAVERVPKLTGPLYVGVKYGRDGQNVALSIAVKTLDGRVFVEGIACRDIRDGNGWILNFIQHAQVAKIVVDGANGQTILQKNMKDYRLKAPILPTVKDIITANAAFDQSISQRTICHANQLSMTQIVSNCDKRAIGTNGGFGYKSLNDNIEIAILDSAILAHWICSESKETRKQSISY